jgi:hypothetical protein
LIEVVVRGLSCKDLLTGSFVPCHKDIIYQSCSSWNPQLQSGCRKNGLEERNIQNGGKDTNLFSCFLLIHGPHKESVLSSKSSSRACTYLFNHFYYSVGQKWNLNGKAKCQNLILAPHQTTMKADQGMKKIY